MTQNLCTDPQRIKKWIKENIHMIWPYLKATQEIKHRPLCLRITFYPNAYPIVMQWAKLSAAELGIRSGKQTDDHISEEMWLISSTFASINDFKDWVNIQ